MYKGNFISLEFIPFSWQKGIDGLDERKRKIALLTLEINGAYVPFNIYKQLETFFPRINNKLIIKLNKKLEGEQFLLDENLHFINFDEIIQKHI